jgi:nickel-type superoxide dismutase maturation protease
MDPDGATLPTSGAVQSRSRPRRPRRARRTAAVAAVAVVAAALVRCVRRVEVTGGSMAPALLEGDRLVVVAPPWRMVPAPGDVVALPDPRAPDRLLVKRVAAVDRSRGTVEVLGDAPHASTDSRVFGPVPLASVAGRAVYRYAPPGRSGPLGRPTEYHRA